MSSSNSSNDTADRTNNEKKCDGTSKHDLDEEDHFHMPDEEENDPETVDPEKESQEEDLSGCKRKRSSNVASELDQNDARESKSSRIDDDDSSKESRATGSTTTRPDGAVIGSGFGHESRNSSEDSSSRSENISL